MGICGKFRGMVINNTDPLGIGRLEINVPDVQGGITAWAMPCLPYAGPGVGFFACPPIDGNVWVEFEGGDVNAPIWTGCFWDAGDAPAQAIRPGEKIFQIPGVRLTLDETPGSGGLRLEVNPPVSTSGVQIKMDSQGIFLMHQGASISIVGNKVSINNGALEVI